MPGVNIVFVEPAFPPTQREFVRALAEVGAAVIGIGERHQNDLDDQLKSWLTHYHQVPTVVDVGVMTVSGADQTTPCTNGTFAATNSSPTPSTSVTVTSTAGDLTASVGMTLASWVTPFTNQTLKWGIDSSSVGGDVGTGTGTTTHTWTDQWSFQTHSVSGANFRAAAF